MNKKVAICGYSHTLSQAPFDNPEWDIFTLNQKVERFPRTTKHFDLHSERNIKSNKKYFEWCENNQSKLILGMPIIELQGAELYPQKEIMEIFGEFFTNSISWMICYAIHKGYEEIGLFGVDLACQDEYIKQRPSVLYFIGLAQGKGIKITLPKENRLFNKERLYWLND